MEITPLSRQSKPDALRDRLAHLALALGPDAKLPTIAQLCSDLGVSNNTLGRALKDLEGQGIIERRNGVGLFAAKTVRENLARCVVLACNPGFFGAAHSPFWDLLVEEARARASQQNETFEMHFAHDFGPEPVAASVAQNIRDGKILGVLGVGVYDQAAAWFESQRVPFISFAGSGTVQVLLDSAAFCDLAIEKLAAKGCRKIALWLTVPSHCPINDWDTEQHEIEWLAPFRAALQKRDLPFHADLVGSEAHRLRVGELFPFSAHQQGFEIARQVFSRPRAQWPDGIVISEDMLAVGALTALRHSEIEPGRDVEVVSHANAGSNVLFAFENAIETVQFHPRDIALQMFSLLDRALGGERFQNIQFRVQPR